MRALRAWLIRLAAIFQSVPGDRELREELESHLQMHISDNVRAGMNREEARRQALIKLGGITQTQELYRQRRGLPFLDALAQDIRYSIRVLSKSRGFTFVATLTLALGIGVNTAVFTAFDALILRPRPVKDPEGLVSTIPAIGTGLMGILTGQLLKNSPLAPASKSLRMAVAGFISVALALIWNLVFPINKNLWTSSFVLLAGGLSLLFLALFYYIIDVRGYKRWAFFFTVIGMNSILIYMSSRVINWKYATDGFFMWLNQLVGEPWNAFVWVMCFLTVKWMLLYFLYKKKVFLRV